MYYVGCGHCGAIGPLWCGGQLMPHPPLYVQSGPSGLYCGVCGVMPPFFTCTYCWTRQTMYVAGSRFLPGSRAGNMAVVVRARENATENEVRNLMVLEVQKVTRKVGYEVVENYFEAWLE